MKGLPNFANMDKGGTNTFLAQEEKTILANITICEALLTQRVNDVADNDKQDKEVLIDSTNSNSNGTTEKTVSFNNSKNTV
jgi:hypothetical protein